MPRRKESLILLLFHSKWWMSVVVSVLFFVGLKYIWPEVFTNESQFSHGLSGIGPYYAPYSFLLLIITPFAYFNTLRKRKLLDKQKSLSTIRYLNWKEFEELVAEAYRRKGYSVIENYEKGPDGGIDLVIKKNTNKYLVQCKHWKNQKVDVHTVREMFGLMSAENADGVIIITSGLFTQDAKDFSNNKPINLVEGKQLLELIGITNLEKVINPIDSENQVAKHICPDCGGSLTVREAKRGDNIGKKFWGCSNFPKCRFTKDYNLI